MSNAREQYAKSLIKQQHHEFLCNPDGRVAPELPKPHQPVYRVPGDSVRVGIMGGGALCGADHQLPRRSPNYLRHF